jgi:heme A synthase
MNTVRRFTYGAFVVACLHLAFGAIVRISGSGMGCGPYWPKCNDKWFPPLDNPEVLIEWSHRGLASILLVSLIALAVVSWQRRSVAGVGGRGGVLRSALLAVGLGFSAAILGAVTVKLSNAPFATLAHWTVAMSLVATVVTCVIRAGGLGGWSARAGGASMKTRRASAAGAVMALLAVVMGGLTAKYPGAAVACRAFPLCGTNPDVARGAVHIQLTHRVLAILLVLHLFGLVMALRKRREAPVIRRAAAIAFSLAVLQLLVAGAMIGMHLPPVLRSLHEATGVSVWIATFVFAYLARLASGGSPPGVGASLAPPPPETLRSGSIRANVAAKHAYAGAIAEREVAVQREPWQGATDAYLGAFAFISGGPSVVLSEAKDLHLAVAELEEESAGPSVATLTQDDSALVVLSEAKDLHVTVAELTEESAGPSVAALAQDDSPIVVLSEVKDLHMVVAELEEESAVPFVVLSEAKDLHVAVPAVALLPHDDPIAVMLSEAKELHIPARKKSTMHHSIAVIVARGADF